MLARNPEKFSKTFTTAVAALVADVTTKEPNNIEASARLMSDMLMADPSLLDELLPSIVYQWCVTRLEESKRHDNRLIVSGTRRALAAASQRATARPPVRGGLSAGQRARANMRRLAATAKSTAETNWLSYQLKGGLQLKDATYSDVIEQRDIHRGHAATNGLKARWFDAIAKNMVREKTVGESLTDGDLAQLYRDASSSG